MPQTESFLRRGIRRTLQDRVYDTTEPVLITTPPLRESYYDRIYDMAELSDSCRAVAFTDAEREIVRDLIVESDYNEPEYDVVNDDVEVAPGIHLSTIYGVPFIPTQVNHRSVVQEVSNINELRDELRQNISTIYGVPFIPTQANHQADHSNGEVTFGSSPLSGATRAIPLEEIGVLTDHQIRDKIADWRAEYGIEPKHIIASSRTIFEISQIYHSVYRILPDIDTPILYGMKPLIDNRYPPNKFALC